MFLLQDQRIVITGANGGIGISICETLLQNKARLVLLYHKKRENIDKLLEEYANSNSSVEVQQVDLLDNLKLKATMHSILESGSVDSFIHSVSAPIENKSVIDLRWEDYLSHIELQTRSFLQIVQSLIQSMREKKHGKIISILTSSTVGRPPSNMSDYIVGKYSLLGL